MDSCSFCTSAAGKPWTRIYTRRLESKKSLSPLHVPRFSSSPLRCPVAPSRKLGRLALHRAPGKILSRKEPEPEILPGRLRAESRGFGLRLSPPYLLPGKTQLFPPDRDPLPAATQGARSAPRQRRTRGSSASPLAAISPQLRAQETPAPAGLGARPRDPVSGGSSAPRG